MIKIEITKDGSKYVIERDSFDAEIAFDDFLNLLFISGVEIEDLQTIINAPNTKLKQNHKKDEPKTIQGFSNI